MDSLKKWVLLAIVHKAIGKVLELGPPRQVAVEDDARVEKLYLILDRWVKGETVPNSFRQVCDLASVSPEDIRQVVRY
jgi:hypothetical protein